MPQIKQATSEPDSIDTLTGFLNSYAVEYLREGIAFLRLDLNNLKAGFKQISDLNAVIQELPWSAEEVQGIAELCDLYIKKLPKFDRVDESIRSGSASVSEAWKNISDLKEDPFLTPSRLAGLLGNFRGLVDEKPQEFDAMKLYDLETYESIKSVKSEYDKYLSSLVNEQASANLIRNQLIVIKSNEELQKTLAEGRALDCMKNSASFLEKFGLNFESLPESETFEITRRLNSPLIKRRGSVRSNLDFSSLTVEFPDSGIDGFGRGGGLGGEGGMGGGGFGPG